MKKHIWHSALIVGLSLIFQLSASAKPQRHGGLFNAFQRRVERRATNSHRPATELRHLKVSKASDQDPTSLQSQARQFQRSTLRLLASFLLRPRDKSDIFLTVAKDAAKKKNPRLLARATSHGFDALMESAENRKRPITW